MKWLTLLICLILLIAGPAASQSDLPIVEGDVFKWGTETIFPMGVRFSLMVPLPASALRNVTLTIEAAGRAPATFEVDLEHPAVTSPNYSEIEFLWTMPDGVQPHLFTDGDIIYEWRGFNDAGEPLRLRNTFTFADERKTWVQSEDPQEFLNLAVVDGGPSPEQIRQSVLLPYNLMSANLDVVRSFDIALYPADLDPSGCELVADPETKKELLMAVGPVSGAQLPCNPARAAALYAASGYDLVQSDGTTVAGAQAALVRFLTRQFYVPKWGAAHVPDWFLSGLTLFYLPTTKAPLLLTVRDAARVDELLPLDKMESRPADARLWEAQSYAMVLYIAEQGGVQDLFDLANALANAPSFQAAYAGATGESLDALLPNLQRWVFTVAAASAFDYTPYLPETPTPTPSWTPSPFPATATSTLTPTATPTVTPSVTGVLSPTPTLTLTVTRTPTPRPATVTPRPASALITPTATPVPGPLDNPTTRLGIVTVLLIVAAILMLIYWLTGRRND